VSSVFPECATSGNEQSLVTSTPFHLPSDYARQSAGVFVIGDVKAWECTRPEMLSSSQRQRCLVRLIALSLPYMLSDPWKANT